MRMSNNSTYLPVEHILLMVAAGKKGKNNLLADIPTVIPKSLAKTKHQQNDQVRNQDIAVKFHSGVSVVDLAKEYKLSKKQIGRIIKAREKTAKHWMEQVPESTSVVLFKDVAQSSYENMEALKALIHTAEKQGEIELAAQGRVKLAGILHKRKDFINDGVTLYQVRKMVKEAKRIIDASRNK